MEIFEVQSIANAYETLYESLATKCLMPPYQKLNNEASNILIESLQDKTLTFSWCHQTCTGTMQLNN